MNDWKRVDAGEFNELSLRISLTLLMGSSRIHRGILDLSERFTERLGPRDGRLADLLPPRLSGGGIFHM